MRRTTFTDQPVTYGAVGGTQAADLLYYPPKGYRPVIREARLGSGEERFKTAAASLMTWGVQRGSGIRVTEAREGTGVQYAGVMFNPDGSPAKLQEHRQSEAVFAEDGSPYIVNGMTAVLKIPFWPFRVSAPLRVVYVIDEQNRVGFAYGTLHGHPLSGEEAFLVEHREDGSVWFVVRAFSRPSNGFYRATSPILRLAQRHYTNKYLRSLLPARAA
ncbi:DUF1990 domain-containing protein [Diaminobutyricibacter tongyongensis]|uniref:DUF1990 domain-containing protein n=1 Tax=Leifsonia tongyongensis TaxID=1268043 RepID=A0A6L9XZN6_9MICO|nr:DUF1990 domain-containing protein [Diaminobutyricibacter tongyongensis]NEN06494.1 DUF1990 domain-containing protein [Diaminobutyricibacter tongyongensis]